MGRSPPFYIVLVFTSIVITLSQPTNTQTDADLDDQLDTSDTEKSVFSAEMESLKEMIEVIRYGKYRIMV